MDLKRFARKVFRVRTLTSAPSSAWRAEAFWPEAKAAREGGGVMKKMTNEE
jgi:hypothetical protein